MLSISMMVNQDGQTALSLRALDSVSQNGLLGCGPGWAPNDGHAARWRANRL
jgi:hypothetical protein